MPITGVSLNFHEIPSSDPDSGCNGSNKKMCSLNKIRKKIIGPQMNDKKMDKYKKIFLPNIHNLLFKNKNRLKIKRFFIRYT